MMRPPSRSGSTTPRRGSASGPTTGASSRTTTSPAGVTAARAGSATRSSGGSAASPVSKSMRAGSPTTAGTARTSSLTSRSPTSRVGSLTRPSASAASPQARKPFGAAPTTATGNPRLLSGKLSSGAGAVPPKAGSTTAPPQKLFTRNGTGTSTAAGSTTGAAAAPPMTTAELNAKRRLRLERITAATKDINASSAAAMRRTNVGGAPDPTTAHRRDPEDTGVAPHRVQSPERAREKPTKTSLHPMRSDEKSPIVSRRHFPGRTVSNVDPTLTPRDGRTSPSPATASSRNVSPTGRRMSPGAQRGVFSAASPVWDATTRKKGDEVEPKVVSSGRKISPTLKPSVVTTPRRTCPRYIAPKSNLLVGSSMVPPAEASTPRVTGRSQSAGSEKNNAGTPGIFDQPLKIPLSQRCGVQGPKKTGVSHAHSVGDNNILNLSRTNSPQRGVEPPKAPRPQSKALGSAQLNVPPAVGDPNDLWKRNGTSPSRKDYTSPSRRASASPVTAAKPGSTHGHIFGGYSRTPSATGSATTTTGGKTTTGRMARTPSPTTRVSKENALANPSLAMAKVAPPLTRSGRGVRPETSSSKGLLTWQ